MVDLGMNHSYFLPHFDQLSGNYKIIFFDQRASGKSAVPSADSISLKFFTEDIEALRKKLGIEKLNLLGHSWGAIPAVHYGITHPEHVKSVILCNAVPLNKTFDSEVAKNQKGKFTKLDSVDRADILSSPAFKAREPESYKKLLLLSFRHSFYNPVHISQLQFDVPKNYAAASRALFTGLGKELGQYDFYDDVRRFNFPVLIIHGRADSIPLEASTQVEKSVPNSKIIIFKKSGHFTFIDEPEKFQRVLLKFLK